MGSSSVPFHSSQSIVTSPAPHPSSLTPFLLFLSAGLITLELDADATPVGPPSFDSERFGGSSASAAEGDQELAALLENATLGGGNERPFGTAALDFRQKYFSGFKKSEGGGKGEETA